MSEKFTILTEYIKDMSSETPSVDTYLYVKNIIAKYNLKILINSQAIKNNLIEVCTKLTYEDPDLGAEKKAYFELVYASVIKVNKEVQDKNTIEHIILVELQKKIFKNLEKVFLDLISNSGYTGVKWEKVPDFDQLYKEKSN